MLLLLELLVVVKEWGRKRDVWWRESDAKATHLTPPRALRRRRPCTTRKTLLLHFELLLPRAKKMRQRQIILSRWGVREGVNYPSWLIVGYSSSPIGPQALESNNRRLILGRKLGGGGGDTKSQTTTTSTTAETTNNLSWKPPCDGETNLFFSDQTTTNSDMMWPALMSHKTSFFLKTTWFCLLLLLVFLKTTFIWFMAFFGRYPLLCPYFVQVVCLKVCQTSWIHPGPAQPSSQCLCHIFHHLLDKWQVRHYRLYYTVYHQFW
jgi:hypothetical protein